MWYLEGKPFLLTVFPFYSLLLIIFNLKKTFYLHSVNLCARKNSNKTLTINWHWIWYCFFYTKVLLHALKFFFVSSILRFFLIFIYMLLKQAHQKLFKNIISYPLWHSHLSRIFQTRLLLLLQTKWKALLRFIFEELVKRD